MGAESRTQEAVSTAEAEASTAEEVGAKSLPGKPKLDATQER